MWAEKTIFLKGLYFLCAPRDRRRRPVWKIRVCFLLQSRISSTLSRIFFLFSPIVEAFVQNCSVEDNSSQRLRIVTNISLALALYSPWIIESIESLCSVKDIARRLRTVKEIVYTCSAQSRIYCSSLFAHSRIIIYAGKTQSRILCSFRACSIRDMGSS